MLSENTANAPPFAHSVPGAHAAAPAIQLLHVFKRYRRYLYRNLSLKGRALDWVRGRGSKYQEFEALKDVSFSIPQGQMVAIVGRNGAGKSTLLRILARVVEPDSGSLQLCGRVSPLLELGAGFSPELSGRRNIYLYGALLGLSRRAVSARFESIVRFSEIGESLDSPIKHYSSGMYLRLAFAVAAHLDPDVLLIDEVLAVGDAAFQQKCLRRIDEFRLEGKTIVLVTHVLQHVLNMCDRALLLHQGSVVDDGPPDRILPAYARLLGT
jgi:ABC-type polysaccharide/polyol phosphate transport system ATPase subunit